MVHMMVNQGARVPADQLQAVVDYLAAHFPARARPAPTMLAGNVRVTIKEWDVPTPHTYPYDVFLDRTGELWSGSMSSDRILRLDPQSGKSIEYLLPRPTNIRRIFIDNSTNPVTFWAGNNHGAEIIKLEPIE